jgi:hypothetical protein
MCSKWCFLQDKTTLFYNAKPKKALALNAEERVKDTVTFQLCCNADGSKRFHPLMVSKFQKPHCLSLWQQSIQEHMGNQKIIYRVAGLFEKENSLP